MRGLYETGDHAEPPTPPGTISIGTSEGGVTVPPGNAAAVADAHADVAAATSRFAQRMQSNATKFSSSATGFAETESDSAILMEQVV